MSETNSPFEDNNPHIERAIDEATEPVVKEMAGLAIRGAEQLTDEVNPQRVVEEAAAVTERADLQEHFMDTMDAARGGVPSLAAAGRATSGMLVEHANARLARGDDPAAVQAELAKAQSWGSLPRKVALGEATTQDVEKYGNDLVNVAGLDPAHAGRLAARAQNPQKLTLPKL